MSRVFCSSKKVCSLFLLLLSSWSAAQASVVAPQNLPDLVEKVLPGVVNISSTTVSHTDIPMGMEDFFQFWGIPRERKQSSLGSGFIINAEQGWVLTNAHVVRNATEVLVSMIDKKTFNAKILGIDAKLDLALLKIYDSNRKVPAGLSQVPFGDSDKVRIAEPVFAVGNPFSLQHTVTVGIISAKNRTIGIGPLDNFLQTDASINPGNSGGPLFNLRGEVIGINTAIFSRTGQSGGLGFAIPSNEAKGVIDDLVRYGRVPRPWLGILAERLTPALAQYYQLKSDKGVVVYNLVKRGPADRAGLDVGDIIISIDGSTILEPNDVERAINKKAPNSNVTIRLIRGSKTLERQVLMTELPQREQLPQGTL
ncbi:MAG: trypsin-like peptidase domain-containing protein [Bdellovibrionales bacterium]|nr:trypsin-like peptidase domain-containing protein [Bdellovibrionales bacterium]